MKKKDLKDLEGFEIPEVNVKGVNSLNQILKSLLRLLAILFIIIAIVEIVIALYIGLSGFVRVSNATNVDIIKKMESNYGEEFIILWQDTDDSGNGKYKIAPKSNEKLICYAYKNNGTYAEDYLTRLLQYRIDNMKDEELKSKFTIQFFEGRENQTFPDNCLLKYDVITKISDYSKIPEAVYRINEFFDTIYTNKDNMTVKMGCGIRLEIDDKGYCMYLYYNNSQTIEQIIYNQRYYYICYYKKNSFDLSDVPKEDIEEIWHPEKLLIYINGKPMEKPNQYGGNTVTFDLEKKEYKVDRLTELFKQVEEIEILGKDEEGKLKIKYKGKEYEVNNTLAEYEALSYDCKLSTIVKTLNIDVEYDYEKGIVNFIFYA